MTEAARDKHLSEVFDAMEAGEATQDDFWDAIFPSLHWCEYELKQLGFHSDYDKLHKIIEDANANDNWYTVVPDTALEYRTITDETDDLEHDNCATVITALRYRKRYLDKIYFPENGMLDLYEELGITDDE